MSFSLSVSVVVTFVVRLAMSVIIAFPVITVFCIVAVANNGLVMPAFIGCIFFPVYIIMNPRSTLIYNNFIAIINIIITVTRW